jgi:DNA-binding response OmpR family regulator
LIERDAGFTWQNFQRGQPHRRDAGAEEFVTKPVDRVELRARLRSMLRLRREFNALREMNDRLTVLQRQRAGVKPTLEAYNAVLAKCGKALCF